MRVRLTPAAAFLAVAMTTLGCHGISTPSNNTTDTFNGTLQPQRTNGHMFTASKTGEMTTKLTAWAPNSQLLVGTAWTVANNDGTCTNSVIQQNTFTTLNTQALGGSIVSGKYCIAIFDVGTLTAAQTYTITVSHP